MTGGVTGGAESCELTGAAQLSGGRDLTRRRGDFVYFSELGIGSWRGDFVNFSELRAVRGTAREPSPCECFGASLVFCYSFIVVPFSSIDTMSPIARTGRMKVMESVPDDSYVMTLVSPSLTRAVVPSL